MQVSSTPGAGYHPDAPSVPMPALVAVRPAGVSTAPIPHLMADHSVRMQPVVVFVQPSALQQTIDTVRAYVDSHQYDSCNCASDGYECYLEAQRDADCCGALGLRVCSFADAVKGAVLPLATPVCTVPYCMLTTGCSVSHCALGVLCGFWRPGCYKEALTKSAHCGDAAFRSLPANVLAGIRWGASLVCWPRSLLIPEWCLKSEVDYRVKWEGRCDTVVKEAGHHLSAGDCHYNTVCGHHESEGSGGNIVWICCYCPGEAGGASSSSGCCTCCNHGCTQICSCMAGACDACAGAVPSCISGATSLARGAWSCTASCCSGFANCLGSCCEVIGPCCEVLGACNV